jgi:hypothetical protein
MSIADFAGTAMEDQSVEIVSVRQARRVLTNGDIKSDVAFQHDVNRLLASLDDLCDAAAAVVSTRGGTDR